AIATLSTAPSAPSATLSPGTGTALRTRKPALSNTPARIEPPATATTSDTSGAYGDDEPSGSSAGPRRLPRNAPPAKPASAKAPPTKPWRHPMVAITSVKATISQSIRVNGAHPTPRSHQYLASRMPSSRSKNVTARRRRVVAIGTVVVVCLGVGVVCATSGGPDERGTVQRFAQAWERGDWRGLRDQLTGDAQARYPLSELKPRYLAAQDTATQTHVTTDKPSDQGDGRWRLPVVIRTQAFGTIHSAVTLDVTDEDGEARIAWTPNLVF